MHGRFEDDSPAAIRSQQEWKQAVNKHRQLLDTRVEYPALVGDAAVFTRPLSWLAAHMMEMRSQGIRVTAEVDDNYLSPQRWNVFMAKAGDDWGDQRDAHMRSICPGDGIIFSTEHLRDIYWKELSKEFGRRHVPELFVCRNHVDKRFMPERPVGHREDGMLRIGYMGSDSHFWDVDLIYPALKEAYELGHEIVMVGINPRYSLLQPTKQDIRAKEGWWDIEYTHVPWSNTFRGTALPLDIGFAPLVVNNHTLGKSDIKALEYAMSGAACVAHNCLVYNRTLTHGEHVLMAGSPAEYVIRMRELIADASLRRRLVENTMQYIEEERLIENNKQEWEQAVYG